MKHLGISLFLVFCSFSVLSSAQVGSPRTDLAVGINGGYTLNTVSFNPTIKQSMKPGMTLGFTARYTCEKYFNMICAFQADLNYTQLGWKELIETSDDTYERTVSYVQLPLLANLGFGRERGGVKGYLVLGPQLAFCIGESDKRTGAWSKETLALRPNLVTRQYELNVEKKFEYGLTGGLGMDVSTKSGHHFLIEGRYYYALSDMFGNSKKDFFGRSANGTIIIKASYLLDVKKTNLK